MRTFTVWPDIIVNHPFILGGEMALKLTDSAWLVAYDTPGCQQHSSFPADDFSPDAFARTKWAVSPVTGKVHCPKHSIALRRRQSAGKSPA